MRLNDQPDWDNITPKGYGGYIVTVYEFWRGCGDANESRRSRLDGTTDVLFKSITYVLDVAWGLYFKALDFVNYLPKSDNIYHVVLSKKVVNKNRWATITGEWLHGGGKTEDEHTICRNIPEVGEEIPKSNTEASVCAKKKS